MHRIWIHILASATDEALAGVKVKISGRWHVPFLVDGGCHFRDVETGAVRHWGRITELRLPIHEGLAIGGGSECSQ